MVCYQSGDVDVGLVLRAPLPSGCLEIDQPARAGNKKKEVLFEPGHVLMGMVAFFLSVTIGEMWCKSQSEDNASRMSSEKPYCSFREPSGTRCSSM